MLSHTPENHDLTSWLAVRRLSLQQGPSHHVQAAEQPSKMCHLQYSIPVSFPSLLPFSPHVVGSPALTQPTQYSNTILINNTSKEFSRSYLMCFMSFSVQMCNAKQGEL